MQRMASVPPCLRASVRDLLIVSSTPASSTPKMNRGERWRAPAAGGFD